MKKIFLALFTAVFVCTTANAQILRAEELEDYAKEKYGEKWIDAAANLGSQLTLDKNNAITYVQVIPAEGKSKDQLYILLNYCLHRLSMMQTLLFNSMTKNSVRLLHKALWKVLHHTQGELMPIQ